MVCGEKNWFGVLLEGKSQFGVRKAFLGSVRYTSWWSGVRKAPFRTF